MTFHRAFDECGDLRRGLEDVIRTGAKRILTSGGAKSASEGATILNSLVQAAEGRVILVPGAGITSSNIAEVVKQTRAHEFHSGLSTALPYSSHDYKKFATEVRKLAERLESLG